MFRKVIVVALSFAFAISFPSIVRAGEPEPQTRTYRWSLELSPTGLGGFAHALLVGPLGGTVVKTRFIVEFVSADAWDAAGVELSIFGPIQRPDGGTGVELEVTGVDFGWSGVGHFQVTYETDGLNGLIDVDPANPVSLWPLSINSFENPYFGRFLELRIELDVVDLVADEFCPGDLNGDGEVSATDLRYFETGECPGEDEPCPADLDFDGVVTAEDREILIAIFGIICPVAP
jgi:hypothetical protein